MPYSSIVRSDEYKRCLLDFVQGEYGIEGKLTPAKRGFYGETWRLDATDKSYFLKLDYSAAHQGIYERSFLILEHLCNHGIDFISRIVKTTDSKLYSRFDNAVLGVFEWINGENIETNETKIPEYQMLAKVYKVPIHDIAIPCEDFKGNIADKFFKQWDALEDMRICSLFEKNRVRLERSAKRLKHFAELCQRDTSGFVLTHGDAGGNFIVNGDQYYIVDWDSPMLAPPERDAWIMGFQDWAQRIFQEELQRNGIDYTLRQERLAYYGYYMFFFWITEHLEGFSQNQTALELEEYFNWFVEERSEYADNLK